jgi:hypothetical protein
VIGGRQKGTTVVVGIEITYEYSGDEVIEVGAEDMVEVVALLRTRWLILTNRRGSEPIRRLGPRTMGKLGDGLVV